MKAVINTTIKFINHEEPQRIVDLWAASILEEILRLERDEQGKESTNAN